MSCRERSKACSQAADCEAAASRLRGQRATGVPSDRSAHRYQSCRAERAERAELRLRLRDLAASRVRYGYRRLHILLKRES